MSTRALPWQHRMKLIAEIPSLLYIGLQETKVGTIRFIAGQSSSIIPAMHCLLIIYTGCLKINLSGHIPSEVVIYIPN